MMNLKKQNSKKTVVVGMSGGVDSSVAAWVLKEEGYNVVGIFMKNWEELDENGNCTSSKDYSDVVSVCEKIGIPYYTVEFIKEYRDNVFNGFLADYEAGLTPNPDVLCNREIKFKVFYEKTRELGADYLATGHYCKTDNDGKLFKGRDTNKDQSYFLNMVKSDVLKNVLFPIGDLEKAQVRAIAKKLALSTKDKKDSTGICFIGERNFKNFLSEYIREKQGDFQTLDGQVVGRHSGAQFYTLGQRKGLGLGGPGLPWFVVAKDIQKNVVYVERGTRHPALFTDELFAGEVTWVDTNPEESFPKKLKAKVRYRQKDQDCTIYKLSDGKLRVVFDVPQRAVTPGQSVVFYEGDLCLGGAIVERTGPNYDEMNRSLPDIVAV